MKASSHLKLCVMFLSQNLTKPEIISGPPFASSASFSLSISMSFTS